MKLSFELSPMGSFEANDVFVTGDVWSQGGKWIAPKKVTVDMRKLTTGITLRDQHVQKKLNTAQYPTAVLSGISVTDTSHGKGTLTFHGATHPIEFDYALNSAKNAVKATFKLKISDWGVTEGLSYMGVSVDDDVDAEVELPVHVSASTH